MPISHAEYERLISRFDLSNLRRIREIYTREEILKVREHMRMCPRCQREIPRIRQELEWKGLR